MLASKLAGAVVVAGAALGAWGVVSAEEPQANAPKVAPAATAAVAVEAAKPAAPATLPTAAETATAVAVPAPAPIGSGGWIAYIDPETGRLTEAPPADGTNVLRADAAFAAGLSTSDAGLVEEVLPDGTVKVNLQGRFQSASYATVLPDGSIAVRHAEGAVPAAAATGAAPSAAATPASPKTKPEPDHDH